MKNREASALEPSDSVSPRSEKPMISIVIPVFNEEENIERAYRAVSDMFAERAQKFAFEIIFTDNHSDDRSFEVISRIARGDGRVRGVRFTRNFGFHRSVLTGLRLAAGDAAVQLDCDLQDPPEVILEFLDRWEKGHDLVIGVRRTRNDGQAHQRARRLFYRVLQAASQDNIQPDSGDFRLLDRSILNQLRVINDASPYLRGLTSVLASNQTSVLYDRRARMAGSSKFPLRRLVSLAIDALLAHSVVPLRLATYTGLVISVLTFLLSLFYLLGHFIYGLYWPAGFVTTTVLLLLGISLNSVFLGIIGEYVARIYAQVRLRPMTVIERCVNIEPPKPSAYLDSQLPTPALHP
jgi:glycosyltransferase involved in cell wall biosynthesis